MSDYLGNLSSINSLNPQLAMNSLGTTSSASSSSIASATASSLAASSSTFSSAIANATANNALADSITDKLKNTDLSTASDDDLMEVCKNFESYFLEQVMKSMYKMASVDGDTDNNNMYSSLFGIGADNSDAGVSTMASYFGDEMVSALAKQVTESKTTNLGLAQSLYEQMKRTSGGNNWNSSETTKSDTSKDI